MDNNLSISSPETHLPIEYANFGARLAAVILDGVIVAVAIFVIGLFIIPALSYMPSPGARASEGIVIGAMFFYFFGIPIGSILYRSFFEASRHQGTPGKIILRIKVVGRDMKRISFGRAFGRNLSKILSSIMMIGYLIALADRKCRTLHDLIADTYVIMKS